MTSPARAAAKLVTRDAVRARIAAWRAAGATVVLAHGVFDLVSAAHARALAAARAAGARLVVTVLDDPAARARLGPDRPVLPASERAALVTALRVVDLAEIAALPLAADRANDALDAGDMESTAADLVARVHTARAG